MLIPKPVVRFYHLFWIAIFVISFFDSEDIRSQPLAVSSISIKDGLSQASVTCFEQDSDGFIWIGTRDGLNRYDGYEFLVVRHELNDSASLSHNFITDIETDSAGNLWVGTIFGLNILNKKNFNAKTLYHWFEDSTSISNNNIRCIERCLQGRMWVGTENGLNLFSPDGTMLKRYGISKDDPSSLSSNRINDLSCDSEGNIWVATDGGLNLIETESDSVIRYLRPFDESFKLGDNVILSVECTSENDVWIGTQTGLAVFDTKKEVFRSVPISQYFQVEDQLAVQSIQSNKKGNNTWVGTPIGLLNLDKNGRLIEKLSSHPTGNGQLRSSGISSLFYDGSGLLWVGTNTSGLATVSTELPVFRSLTFPVEQGYSLGSNNINSICLDGEDMFLFGTQNGIKQALIDSSGKLEMSEQFAVFNMLNNKPISSIVKTDSLYWISTRDSGIVRYDKFEKSYTYFRYSPEQELGLTSNNINELLLDRDQNLWIATMGGGLCYLQNGSEIFENFRFEGASPNALRDNNVTCLEQDSLGNIWVGTANGGLFCLDLTTKKFTPYSTGEKEGMLSSNSINDLYIDYRNHLWVATSGGGVCKLAPKSKKFEVYSTNTGLVNDVVLAVSADENGYIWLTTNTGISAFNLKNKTFKNYLDFQLSGDNTFNKRAISINAEGLAVFGGANGVNYLNVAKLKHNQFRPQTAITSFQLLGEESPRQRIIRNTFSIDTIVLEYNHSGFEIEFAALNYLNPDKNKYKYRLKGLFDRWRPASETRKATFSNLNPGNYVFEVLGSNNDGVWSNVPARLNIRVRPAFWQTIWFQVTGIIIIVGILLLIYRYRISMETIRRHELEKAVEERTSEIAKERDTNAILLQEIHHRVKNNLQIIVSLLSLQSRFITNPALLNTFSEIQNRVRSMSLIHQKMYQTEDLKSVNIEEYIRDLSNSLVSTYRLSNQIDLDVNVEVNSFNSDTLTPLGLIINEVISNSLKYAFEEDRSGKITVSLKKKGNNRYELLIGDDGVGMDKEIFGREGESFGTELISALVEQLNGEIELLDRKKGTYYRIEFEDVG